MPPLEVQDKVLVKEEFLDTVHGRVACTSCHGGTEPAKDRAEAHVGLIPNPSAEEEPFCATCHADQVEAFRKSLHYTNNGIVNLETGVLAPRVNPEKVDVLQVAVDNHCASCHITTCGDCHVNRPEWSGGGFLAGHQFRKTPNPVLNCMACHGSRVQKEMLGQGPKDQFPDIVPDVHWAPLGMDCTACHTGEWFHSPSEEYARRYDNKEAPRCEDCHAGAPEFAKVTAHQMHAMETSSTLLQCQVCHAQPYNNCAGCHVGKDDKGLPYFKTDRSWFDFKIGRNPDKSEDRPYDYVVVRHVPVARDTFAFYGEDLLSNYDAEPTFKYATPHTIVRVAPQAESCGSCHNNAELFLTEEDVPEDEREANREVIVDRLPPAMP